jgi:hypothetical protein
MHISIYESDAAPGPPSISTSAKNRSCVQCQSDSKHRPARGARREPSSSGFTHHRERDKGVASREPPTLTA